jgi:hypothetical protein
MTMNQIISRLARNATDFRLAGETEKSNSCMDLLAMIKDKGLENVKGKILVDNV